MDQISPYPFELVSALGRIQQIISDVETFIQQKEAQNEQAGPNQNSEQNIDQALPTEAQASNQVQNITNKVEDLKNGFSAIQTGFQKMKQENEEQAIKLKNTELQLVDKVRQYLEIKQIVTSNTTFQDLENLKTSFSQFARQLFGGLNNKVLNDIIGQFNVSDFVNGNFLKNLFNTFTKHFKIVESDQQQTGAPKISKNYSHQQICTDQSDLLQKTIQQETVIQEQKQQLSQMTKQIQENEEQLEQLKQYKHEHQQIEQKLKGQQNQIQQILQNDPDSNKQLLVQQKELINVLKEQVQNLHTQVIQKQAKLKEYEEQSEAVTPYIMRLGQKFQCPIEKQSVQEKSSIFNQILEKVEKELDSQQTELRDIKERNQIQTEQNDKLKEEVQYLKDTEVNLNNKIVQITEEYCQMRQQLNTLINNVDVSDSSESDEREKMEQEIIELKHQLKLLEQHSNQSQTENSNLKKTIQQLNDKLDVAVNSSNIEQKPDMQDKHEEQHKYVVQKLEQQVEKLRSLVLQCQNEISVKNKEMELYEKLVIGNMMRKSQKTDVNDIRIVTQEQVIKDLVVDKTHLQQENEQLKQINKILFQQFDEMKLNKDIFKDIVREEANDYKEQLDETNTKNLKLEKDLQAQQIKTLKYYNLLTILIGEELLQNDFISIVGAIDQFANQLREMLNNPDINIYDAAKCMKSKIVHLELELQTLQQQTANSNDSINQSSQQETTQSESFMNCSETEQEMRLIIKEIQKLFGVTDRTQLVKTVQKDIKTNLDEQQNSQDQIKALKQQLQMFEDQLLQMNDQLYQKDEQLHYDFTAQEFNTFYNFVEDLLQKLDNLTNNKSQTWQVFKSSDRNLINFLAREKIVQELLNGIISSKSNVNYQSSEQVVKHNTKDQLEQKLLKTTDKVLKLQQLLLEETYEREKLRYWQQFRTNSNITLNDCIQHIIQQQADESKYSELIQKLIHNNDATTAKSVLKDARMKK